MVARDREDIVEVERAGLAQLLAELGEEALHVQLMQGKEHLLLAREVQVDRALGHTRPVGDLGHARHAVGVLEVKGLDRIEDLLAALGLVLGGDGVGLGFGAHGMTPGQLSATINDPRSVRQVIPTQERQIFGCVPAGRPEKAGLSGA
jgi:hypothetical protein